LDDLFRFGPSKEVVVQLPTFCAEGKIILRLFAEIKNAAVGVVEENAYAVPLRKPDEERDGLYRGSLDSCQPNSSVFQLVKGAVAAIHGAGFVAQSVIVFVERHFLPGVNVLSIPGHRQTWFVRKKHMPVESEKLISRGER